MANIRYKKRRKQNKKEFRNSEDGGGTVERVEVWKVVGRFCPEGALTVGKTPSCWISVSGVPNELIVHK